MTTDKNGQPLNVNDHVLVDGRRCCVVDKPIGTKNEVCVSAFGVLSGDWVGRWVPGDSCIKEPTDGVAS